MPNPQNITKPVLVIGSGRTATSYFLDRLRHGHRAFFDVIENDIYRDLYDRLQNASWCHRWRHVADEQEIERRVLEAIRQVFLVLLPSEQPEWAMKCIWAGHDPALLDRLFPHARYVHLVRDPRTNIPSMMERLGHDRQLAEKQYVESNANALLFQAREGRYLRIRQEDFIDDREQTWARICQFLGVETRAGRWERVLNESESTQGRVEGKRAHDRLRWRELPIKVREMAEGLGYTEMPNA